MNDEERKKLETIALERLLASGDGDEKWSFLFRTVGSAGLICCRWVTTEDWEFDGEIAGLSLPWPQGRLGQIAANSEFTTDELVQWRRAKCQQLAAGSDWSTPAWIVPLRTENSINGWALFLCEGPVDAAPCLMGVFDGLEDAGAALNDIAADSK